MKRFSVVSWFRNIPISRKLYFTVGLMALLIIIELATLSFAVKTLSAVRAYVGAEGLWSKAEKDAAYNLGKYGRTHNEADYQAYQKFLAVPLGDHKTRMELRKAEPDYAQARQGFIEGRLHPDDIDGAIQLFRRFHSIYYIDKAIAVWSKGDTLITELVDIGQQLHNETTSPTRSDIKIATILDRLDPLNDKLTHIEDDFSYTLGEGSRWLEHLILRLLFCLVLTVEVCGLTITIMVSRGITKGLNEIISSSEKIAAGDLDTRAKIYAQDEIGILANSFNQMTTQLQINISKLKSTQDDLRTSTKLAERSAVVKENFLANMSHEIRTPMNAVLGFTDILEHTKLDDEQRQVVEYLKVSGKNLLALINDILDYSKIESGMIVIEQTPFSIQKTFASLEVLLRQKAQDKNIALKLRTAASIPENVMGDPTRLLQILLNLADNAIKFTEQGSVEISAAIENETAQDITIAFEVMDTGLGIPVDMCAVIFDRFTQVSADTTRKHGGTGLGLSIVKSLVGLQNGTILVQSEEGKGSVFSFTITYKKVTVPGTIPNRVSPMPMAKGDEPRALRILLAEDNQLNQMVVLKSLKKFGFTIDVADNGKIAVEKLKGKSYDLVLMDIQMPEMDGHEATRIIRQELKNDIPIIALTAHAMNEEKEKCFRSGMNEFMSKPFDAEALHNMILMLCKAA